MDDFRSKSYRDGMMQRESSFYGGGGGDKAAPATMQELRSYSVSYAETAAAPNQLGKMKKGKSTIGSSSTSSSSSRSWSFSDPELQRKKRVASYKAYAMEGKMKGSFRKSFRWIKDTCSQVVYGWK